MAKVILKPGVLGHIVLTGEDRCEYEGCSALATCIAVGKDQLGTNRRQGHKLGVYCNEHTELVLEEGSPEYRTSCPTCGCKEGIN